MKKSSFNFAAVTFLSVAMLTVPAVSRAAGTSTNSTSATADASAPGKISGTVTAVDTNAMTFTVGGQTYSETSSSILTRNGKPAMLSEVAVGDAVHGTCTTGSDGKLEAAKVKFGKGEASSTGTKAKTTAKKPKKKKKSSATSTNAVPDSVPAVTVPEPPAPLPPVMGTATSSNLPAPPQ